MSDNNREAVNEGLADYTPLFLSEVPELLKKRAIAIDVALVQASLPDARGNMSLGVSVDIVKSAIETARKVIVQVNSYMPRVFGDTFIKPDDVDYIVSFDEPLVEFSEIEPVTFRYGGFKCAARLISKWIAFEARIDIPR